MTNPQETVDSIGLTVTSVFVPFSKSRNRDNKHKTLNWIITLHFKNAPLLTTEYSAGIGHCPSYRQMARYMEPAWKGSRLTYDQAIAQECETGRNARTRKPINPDSLDVIYSLVMDSDVLGHATFEDWASDYGYDPDSHKAESIYQDCLKIALQLRNTIGERNLEELREAFQDY